MTDYPQKDTFVFDSEAGNVAMALEQCLKHVDAGQELSRVSDAIRSKVRWTLTELLINAVKHSGVKKSFFYFEFGNSDFKILKVDSGEPFRLLFDSGKELVWPLKKSDKGSHFEVYRNGTDSLSATIVGAETAEFTVHELYEPEISELLHTSEHFGLMIIAKAADSFTYQFDRESRSNIFSVTFKYKHENSEQHQT